MYQFTNYNELASETPRSRANSLLHHMKDIRSPYELDWEDIDKWVVPGFVRLDPSERHAKQGSNRRKNIIDNRATRAHRTFQAGMHTGNTSKARPWHRTSTFDPAVRDLPDVKMYTDRLDMAMRDVMAKSNIYDTFMMKYGALGAIGTACSYLSPDPHYVVRNTPLIAGHYWVAENQLGVVDRLIHAIPMTTVQILQTFNKKSDNVPNAVKEAYRANNKDQVFIVYHLMEPRDDYDAKSLNPTRKKYASNYWMDVDDDKDRLLRESGSDINRIICSRWNKISLDPYGYSLGGDVTSDSKQLQHAQSTKMEIRDKTTRPPMVGPNSMKNQRHSLLPGSITYSDEIHQRGGYRPAIDLTSYDQAGLLQDIAALQEQIDKTYHVDLFRAISEMPGVQPRNQFELAERKEEQLLQLGPALERLQTEELAPTIRGVYHYMKEAGFVPEMPDTLENEEDDLTIEYVSIMAQAQKAVSTTAIERVAGFVGNMAGIKPEVMDKFNADQAIDEYAERLGAPTAIIIPDDEVKKVRDERNAQMQQQAQIEQISNAAPAIKQGVEAAQLLSETDSGLAGTADQLDQLNLNVGANYG